MLEAIFPAIRDRLGECTSLHAELCRLYDPDLPAIRIDGEFDRGDISASMWVTIEDGKLTVRDPESVVRYDKDFPPEIVKQIDLADPKSVEVIVDYLVDWHDMYPCSDGGFYD